MKTKSSIAILLWLAIVLFITGALASPRQHSMAGRAPNSPANPVPLLNQPLVPDAAVPGGPGFTLTVNGTGFVAGATANWNGSPRATTFFSGSQLAVQITAADIATAQSVSVTVTNPSTLSSNPMWFLVSYPSGTSNFVLTNTSPVGAPPSSIASGDFNGDGKLDLAVGAAGTGTSVTILLGNGNGTFTTGASYTVVPAPSDIIVADFNGDDKMDLAVGSSTTNAVSILLGNGDGTFQAQTTNPTGNWPLSIAAADLNGDGKMDLVTANQFDNTVSVLLGNGDGTFQTHMDFAAGAVPASVALGDFNGDGHVDMAVATINSGISILLGNGDGTFQAPVSYSEPHATDVVVADFNGDGKLDLAFTVISSNGVDIMLGNGDGTFQTPLSNPMTQTVGQLAAGDFNGDSKVDLAFSSNNSAGDLFLLLGNGDGTFQPAVVFPFLGLGVGIAAGDYNGDGLLDLVLANSSGSTVSTALQTTLAISPLSVDFQTQGVLTTSRPLTVTLANIGGTPIPISSISIIGSDASVFAEQTTCGTSIAVNATCTISLTFTPKNAHDFTATLSISDGAVGSPQLIPLSGVGAFARFTLAPNALHFGNQTVGTTSNPQVVTLKDTGNVTLALTSISFAGTNQSDFAQTSNCPRQIQKGSSCQIRVTFTPSGTGTRSAKMLLKGAFVGGFTSVPMNGTGTN